MVAAMADIRPASDTRFAKLCIFGDPGVGKTRFVGTSPGRVLLLRPPTDHVDAMLPGDRDRVQQWVIDDWSTMNEALDYLRLEGKEWDWVWVDSFSLLQDHLLDDIWETVVEEKPARARYGVDRGEYGLNMSRLSMWIRHAVGPDSFNFGFTAHPVNLEPSDDPESTQKLMPWIQGRMMSPKFCGYMNVVSFMEVAKIGGKEGRRVLRMNATERYYAKDQFDSTKDGRLVDPTMPELVRLIEESRGRPLGEADRTTTRTQTKTKTRRRVKVS